MLKSITVPKQCFIKRLHTGTNIPVRLRMLRILSVNNSQIKATQQDNNSKACPRVADPGFNPGSSYTLKKKYSIQIFLANGFRLPVLVTGTGTVVKDQMSVNCPIFQTK
jgi:hypothetical protein